MPQIGQPSIVRKALLACLLSVSALTGCGDDGNAGGDLGGAPIAASGGADGVSQCPAPGRLTEDGSCVPPGVQDDGCPAGTLMNAAGACQAAGIPPEACGEGFAAENGSCTPILPTTQCAEGQMAIPGETSCRPVMDCGSGRWGALPVDATTQYVDGSYGGGKSDGSADKPWTRIGAGVDAAAAGALVAVAAGTYREQVLIENKAVRLWGVCPARVHIDGAGQSASIAIAAGADGTVVGGVATFGGARGFNISGSIDLSIERVWVHGATDSGIFAINTLGPTELRVSNALLANNIGAALVIHGGSLELKTSVVRDTLPRPSDRAYGRGIDAGSSDEGQPSKLKVRRSLIEDNHDLGIFVMDSEAEVDSTVVRGTLPRQIDQQTGIGIRVQQNPGSQTPAMLKVRRSWLADNYGAGIHSMGGDVLVEATVSRDHRPRAADGIGGYGLVFFDAANIEVSACAIEDNHDVGIAVAGSNITITSTRISGTLPLPSEGAYGWGLGIEPNLPSGLLGSLRMSGSLIDNNHEVGVMLNGAEAQIDGTVVRATKPRPGGAFAGRGMHVQPTQEMKAEGKLKMHASVVSDSSEAGIFLNTNVAEITGTLIEHTAVSPLGRYGDGLVVMSTGAADGFDLEASILSLRSSSIVESARAGLSNHGSLVVLEASTVRCAQFALNGEVLKGRTQVLGYEFDDAGDNACGCPEAIDVCHAVSAGLQAPAPTIGRP